MTRLFSDDPMYIQALVDRNYGFFRAEFAELWEIHPSEVDALFDEHYPSYIPEERAEIIDLLGPYDYGTWQDAVRVGVHEFWEGVCPEEMAEAMTEAGYPAAVLRTEDYGIAAIHVSATGREYLFSGDGSGGRMITVYEPDLESGFDLGHTPGNSETPMTYVWSRALEDAETDDAVAAMRRDIVYFEDPPQEGDPAQGMPR
jgi:hypothetical protein